MYDLIGSDQQTLAEERHDAFSSKIKTNRKYLDVNRLDTGRESARLVVSTTP